MSEVPSARLSFKMVRINAFGTSRWNRHRTMKVIMAKTSQAARFTLQKESEMILRRMI